MDKVKRLITIIIPTYDNPQFLNPCVDSIVKTGILSGLAELIIVNNGKTPIDKSICDYPSIRVINAEKNLGWEGGLQLGLDNSESEFVCFQNDDTHIPQANSLIYNQLLGHFKDPRVGAVGPSTTVAAGNHSIYQPSLPNQLSEVSFLIFFMVMVRRKALDEAGGIDPSTGADDIDLSIRLKQAGYKLLVDPFAFIIHHAFQTGPRLRGDHTTKGGWNSPEMSETTNRNLIRKHGFRTFFETVSGTHKKPDQVEDESKKDIEGKIIKEMVRISTNEIENPKIVELGVGATKTVPNVIGVDRVAKGEVIPFLAGAKSVADVVADISEPLPKELNNADMVICRHILEHCPDTVKTIKIWSEILKMGGKMIIAVPDGDIGNTIPMNPEHLHQFYQESLENIFELCGFKQVTSVKSGNGISFISVFEKL